MIKQWIQSLTASKKITPSAVSTPKPTKAAPKKESKQKENKTKPQPKKKLKPLPDVPVCEGKTRFQDLPLHPLLQQAIHQQGFHYCTPIQAQTLPHTLKGLDMIGKAQTGTGKTAAFLITLIDQLLAQEPSAYLYEPKALVIAPTRELVHQIAQDAEDLCRHTGLSVVCLVGGENYDKQENQLNTKPVDIVVATPGRLIDFVERQKLYLDQVVCLVLDEADRMLDMGFIPQVKRIVRNTPHKDQRQTLLFSATFTQDIINLSQQWTVDPAQVEIEPEHVATDTVKQIAYMVADGDKMHVLQKLLLDTEYDRAIIFANRRDQTQRLYDTLKKKGFKLGILSGEISQNKRTRTLENFKEGKIRVLIATDVVGRGIHIDGVSHVINYNLPQEPENYVHRIGRTGRAGASGTSISLIGEEDAYEVLALEELLGEKLTMELPPDYLLER